MYAVAGSLVELELTGETACFLLPLGSPCASLA
jgi:hypothetical protein